MTKIISGIVSALVVAETSKGKPKLDFVLTSAEGEATPCIVYTEDRIATFAEVKDGDEIAVKGSVSNGRYAPEGTLVVAELDPEMPEPAPFYAGEDIVAGTPVVLTSGAFARKSVTGFGIATVDLTAEMINAAQASAAEQGIGWQEVLVAEGAIEQLSFTELHTTRAYKDGDTKPAVQNFTEDREKATEYARKISVAGYAQAAKEAAEAAAAAEAEASQQVEASADEEVAA